MPIGDANSKKKNANIEKCAGSDGDSDSSSEILQTVCIFAYASSVQASVTDVATKKVSFRTGETHEVELSRNSNIIICAIIIP